MAKVLAQIYSKPLTMGSTSNSATPVSSSDAARALDIVRNSEDNVPAEAQQTVEKAIPQLWSRLQANQSYVMNKDEFALFNYARARYTSGSDAAMAQRAVQRFWNVHRGSNGAN